NDKAGPALKLVRWVSARAIKETYVPPTDWRYPHQDVESLDPPVGAGAARPAPARASGGAASSGTRSAFGFIRRQANQRLEPIDVDDPFLESTQRPRGWSPEPPHVEGGRISHARRS